MRLPRFGKAAAPFLVTARLFGRRSRPRLSRRSHRPRLASKAAPDPGGGRILGREACRSSRDGSGRRQVVRRNHGLRKLLLVLPSLSSSKSAKAKFDATSEGDPSLHVVG